MPARIKSDDQVIVTSGKDRGKQGRVLRVDPKNERVFVEGLNMIKRHQKANPMSPTAQQTSGATQGSTTTDNGKTAAKTSGDDQKSSQSGDASIASHHSATRTGSVCTSAGSGIVPCVKSSR